MTENEVIEWRKAFKKTYKGMPKEVYEACEMAIKALEEIQKYRSIGTVEECLDAVERRKIRTVAISERGKKFGMVSCDKYGWAWCGGNEHFPSKFGPYLCSILNVENGYMFVAILLLKEAFVWSWHEKSFEGEEVDYSLNKDRYRVIAWQPLPEPYKSKQGS